MFDLSHSSKVPLTEAVATQLRNLNRCYNSGYGYSYYPSTSYYGGGGGGGFNLASLIGRHHRVMNYIDSKATSPLPHPPSSFNLGTFGQHQSLCRQYWELISCPEPTAH